MAGSSHETTRPGFERSPSQRQPRPDTAPMAAMAAATETTEPTTRARRARGLAPDPAHHQPMKAAPMRAGIFTSAARAHRSNPTATWRLLAAAQPATSRPSMRASLCELPSRSSTTSGFITARAKALPRSRPTLRARTGTAQAMRPTPTRATRRKPTRAVRTSRPESCTIQADSLSQAGPYGAGECAHRGSTSRRYGPAPSAAGPWA